MDPNIIKYLMVDPSISELTKDMPIPTPPLPPFHVVGYEGGGHELNTLAGQAANVYVAIANALNDVNTAVETPMNGWAASSNLPIIPRAGVMFNAYYNRESISLFYGTDGYGNTIYTADSPKIVCHELGHAILDYYRPDLFNAINLEVWAFHEAFGDLIAMLSVMLHDEVLTYCLKQTSETLSGSNIICNVGEQLAAALFSLHMTDNKFWLRTGFNKYFYTSPEKLPQQGTNDMIVAEPHSFSRIMFGAFYDILVLMFQNYIMQGFETLFALRKARETLGRYALKAILTMPTTAQFYEGFARTLLQVDFNEGNPFQTQIYDVFISRRILTGQLKLLSESDRTVHACKVIRLSDHLLRTQSYNPLYDLEIEVPNDDQRSITSAQQLINYLHNNNKVSDSHETPFEISNGKLIRSHFACGCCGLTKFQPEFQKPYKPKNNAGCGIQPSREAVSPTPAVKRGCSIRYRVSR